MDSIGNYKGFLVKEVTDENVWKAQLLNAMDPCDILIVCWVSLGSQRKFTIQDDQTPP